MCIRDRDVEENSSMGNGNLYWDGAIDNLTIWNKALSPEEVISYMYCPPTSFQENLISLWTFENLENNVFTSSLGLSSTQTAYLYGNETNLQNEIISNTCTIGCTISDSITVTINPSGCTDSSACNFNDDATCDDGSCEYITPVDLGEDITKCDESVTLDAGEGYDSYLWSNGETTQSIEVSESGDYSVEVGAGNANNYSMSLGEDDNFSLDNLNLDNTSFTISIDFKSNDGSSYQALMRNYEQSDDFTNGFYLRFESGSLHFDVNNFGLPQQYPNGGNLSLIHI